jgi:hypothetical protein
VVAGHLAGLAGNLSFDLREQARSLAYFEVAVQAADDADAPDLAAWALATRSIVPAYTGDPAAALRLLREAQDRAGGHVSPSRRAWLAAMEAKAHSGLGDAGSSLAALGRAEAPSSERSRKAARSATTSSTCPGWPASVAPATCSLYRADGATYQGAPPDPSESTRVEWVPVADLRKLIDKGQLTDGPSLLGLSLALALPPPDG